MQIGKLCTLLILLIFSSAAVGQQGVTHVLMPTFNATTKVDQNWRVNLKLESRFESVAATFGEEEIGLSQTDLAMVASRKINLNNRLGFGSMVRFRDKSTLLRLIQQYTLIRSYSGFRLSHRFASDQTWGEKSPFEVRLRYRVLAQIPLNGQTVNAREFYLKLGHEYLPSIQSGDYDLEVRLVPALGYEITDRNKVEAGAEHRIDSFLAGSSRNRLFWTINWYVSFDSMEDTDETSGRLVRLHEEGLLKC